MVTESMMKIMEQIKEIDPEYTVYELARGLWNLNSDIKVPKIKMPNYLELK